MSDEGWLDDSKQALDNTPTDHRWDTWLSQRFCFHSSSNFAQTYVFDIKGVFQPGSVSTFKARITSGKLCERSECGHSVMLY
ncbi:hypothetical protein PGTUg99_016449 [Puccinia graminis f. sp. tritici]|uniref:Uncharacterized protein n=1 Tax=Puccinia graminis f. sp. tritici TaxID=56615 RepID=A0A5B0RA96_PUCGR|nr:hypothetical protein PGTUg99_016449 [Puccinia graminis f. sp. tritici]